MPRKSLSKRIFYAVLTAVLTAVLLCSCGGNGEGEVSYTVISDGVTVGAPSASAPFAEDTGTVSDGGGIGSTDSGVSSTVLQVPDHMVSKYYSLSYNDRMRDAYEDVANTIANFRSRTYVPLTINTSEYVSVLETVRCEQLAFFHVKSRSSGEFDNSAHTFEMNFSYKYSIREMNIMLRETEQAAMEIISRTEGMTDYEKLKYFHDYFVLNVESDTDDPYADNIYGALVNKKALCEGFAKAFSYLCNISGIENMIVTGYTDVAHMWNMVKLDGKWYHIDVGWDKPAASLTEHYPDMVLYQYFLTDDTVIGNNRIISNMMGDPPKADGTDMNYFYREGKYAADYSEALDIIERSCARCIDAGEKYFMLKLDSSNLYLRTTSDLIKPGADGLSDIDRIVRRLNFTGRMSYIDYYKAYRLIIFVLE